MVAHTPKPADLASSSCRVVVSSGDQLTVYNPTHQPVPILSDTFEGHFFCRTRRPGDPYFDSLKRRFEFQIQGQFKRPLKGNLWVVGELEKAMNLNLPLRMVSNLILKFFRTLRPTMHYSFGEGDELAHIGAPVQGAFDRIVETPPGEAPPVLGSLLPEDPTRRFQNAPDASVFKPGYTYTMALYSAHVDFETWQTAPLPGVGTVDLHSFWKDCPLVLSIYTLDNEKSDSHSRKARTEAMRLEIVHSSLPRWSTLGSASQDDEPPPLSPDNSPEESPRSR